MVDERTFLDRIAQAPDDDKARQVYADWLCERDTAISRARAALLRAQAESRPLPPASRALGGGWLARVDRTGIDRCGAALEFAYGCPKRWQDLQPTGRARIRFCAACQQEVRHCSTVGEARQQARLGRCVAVSSLEPRRPGDLEARAARMGRVGPGLGTRARMGIVAAPPTPLPSAPGDEDR